MATEETCTTCATCGGEGKAARGWSGNHAPDGVTCPDCRGTVPAAAGESAEVLASARYKVTYSRPGSVVPATSTLVGAYSVDDARRRVLESMSLYEGVEIVEILGPLHPGPVPVTCTYLGEPGGPWGSAWQILADVDRNAPVLVCDVHKQPAHARVYDSETDEGTFSGPCQWHPDPDGGI